MVRLRYLHKRNLYCSECFYALFLERLSELRCLTINELLFGKYVLSMSPKTQSDKVMEDSLKIEWPDDYILMEKFFRSKA